MYLMARHSPPAWRSKAAQDLDLLLPNYLLSPFSQSFRPLTRLKPYTLYKSFFLFSFLWMYDFFLTEKSSACTMYPAPRNGALGCINITFSSLGVVPICYAMCKSEFDFVSKAERIYICYQGQWKTRLLEPALPWPDCSGKPKAIIT